MSTYHHAVERTIYVGNIGRGVTEQALLALFGHCGTVTQIRLAGDPSFETRYAFIEFGHPEEVRTALLLDGMQVYERSIRVSQARGGGPLRNNDPDRVNKTIHVAGIPMDDIEEDALAEFFSHCGEVVAVRKSGRFAWVEFATTPGMQAALRLDGEPLGNSNMKVQQSRTPIMNAGWRAAPKEQTSASRAPSQQPAVAAPEATTDSSYPGHYTYMQQGAGHYGYGYAPTCGQSPGDVYGHGLLPQGGAHPVIAPPQAHSCPPSQFLGPGMPCPPPPQMTSGRGCPIGAPADRGIAGASQASAREAPGTISDQQAAGRRFHERPTLNMVSPPPDLGGRRWSDDDLPAASRDGGHGLAGALAVAQVWPAAATIMSWMHPELEEQGLKWRRGERTRAEVVAIHNSSGAKDAYRNPRWKAPADGRYNPPSGLSVQAWMRVAEWSARGELPEGWQQGAQTKHGQWWHREQEERKKVHQESLQRPGHWQGDWCSPLLQRKREPTHARPRHAAYRTGRQQGGHNRDAYARGYRRGAQPQGQKSSNRLQGCMPAFQHPKLQTWTMDRRRDLL